jgi:hypothetical protein
MLLSTWVALACLPNMVGQMSALMCCLLPRQPFLRVSIQDDKHEI